MNGGNWFHVTAYDFRGCSNDPIYLVFVLLTRAAVPDTDGKCQNALNFSAVEVSQYGMTDFEFL